MESLHTNRRTGILYCNSGLAAGEAVADFSVALIIGTFRALPYCISSASSPTSFQAAHERATGLSHNLRGHVLGLVGFGNIGQQIAHRCSAAFGMEITYYDVERKSAAVEAGLHARYCMTLESLIRGADCVVLCAPSGAGRIINADSLRWFKPDARLVNVARGALVDEDALADALEQDRLGSVALDVHADEPRVSEKLKKFAGSKALLTCHNAGGTVETHVGFEELCMRNIMAVLSGREAVTPVNLQWLR
jgi:lactate dehydrogenase-like 2-hydroxyacid dehydrogenase